MVTLTCNKNFSMPLAKTVKSVDLHTFTAIFHGIRGGGLVPFKSASCCGYCYVCGLFVAVYVCYTWLRIHLHQIRNLAEEPSCPT